MGRAEFVEEEEFDEEIEADVIGSRYLDIEMTQLRGDTNDPFLNIPKELLDKNAKRRMERLEKKYNSQGSETTGAGFVSQVSSNSLNPFMTIKNPTTKLGAQAKYLTPEQVYNGYFIWHLAPPPFNLDYLTDLMLANPTHAACIQAKATNIVGLGYNWNETTKIVLARQEIEEEDDVKIQKLSRKLANTKEKLNDWIESLNNVDTFIDTMSKIWKDVEATGNGYLEIGRNRNGAIGYVGHIPAYTMRVRVERDGYIQLLPSLMNKLVFFRNFGDTMTKDPFSRDDQPNEVIHIKKEHPRNAYYGIPDIIAGLPAIAGDKFAVDYNLEYFENKAVPRYALIVKGAKLSTQAERRILEYFRKEVKGNHHGTLYIPVPTSAGGNVDVELKPIENQVQDSSFHQYREDNRIDILMVHRVAPSIIGVEMQNLAAARESLKVFKEQVVKPEQTRVEIRLNRTIIKEQTDIFTLEFDQYDLVDEETQSRIDDRYIRNGTKCNNEVRSKLGLPPRKGGNKYIDPSIMSPGGDPMQPPAAPGGAPRHTTDGSPKNADSNRTPMQHTPTGRALNGTLQDQGTESDR